MTDVQPPKRVPAAAIVIEGERHAPMVSDRTVTAHCRCGASFVTCDVGSVTRLIEWWTHHNRQCRLGVVEQ